MLPFLCSDQIQNNLFLLDGLIEQTKTQKYPQAFKERSTKLNTSYKTSEKDFLLRLKLAAKSKIWRDLD